MSSPSYSEKLRHPKWQMKRLRILERDNATCQLCGDTETELHIHHKKYSGQNPWDTEDDFLETLCIHCHALVEECKDFCKPHDFYFNPISIIKDIKKDSKSLYVYICMGSEEKPPTYAYLLYILDENNKVTHSYFIEKNILCKMHETIIQNPTLTHV
jgi:RNA polymerase subunit RPABC4/transcription elongation factor Spt4